jgi:ATP-dependent DNA helicase RecG
LAEARKTVIQILEDDSELMREENLILRKYFEKRSGGISWDKIS